MRKMRTAEEMVNYCKERGTNNSNWKNLKQHFKIIENILREDEYVVCCFGGYQPVIVYGDEPKKYVYALTNRRLLKARVGFKCRILYSTIYENLNYIESGSYNVVIDSNKAEESVEINEEIATNLKNELQLVLPIIMKQKASYRRATRFTGSVADELIKFKQLRDEGVLTEAEFQKQKDLLLNPGWDEFVVDFDVENKDDKKTYRVKRPLRIHKKK